MLKSSQRKISLLSFLLLLGLITWVVATMIQPYALSILMGGIIAVLAAPGYERLRASRFGPRAAALTLTAIVLVLVVAPLIAFVGAAAREGKDLLALLGSQALPDAASLHALSQRLASFIPKPLRAGVAPELQTQLVAALETLGAATTQSLLHLAANVPETLLQVTLAAVAAYFFMVDGRRFAIWLSARIPLDQDVQVALMRSFHSTTVRVIWASIVTAAVQAAIVLVGWVGVGLSGGLLAAGATFLMSWVPIVGSAPVWAGAALYLLGTGSAGPAIVMLVTGVVAGLSDNVVRPLLLKGEACALHPLVSLAAIFGGIQMFGIFGVVIGPILAAIFVYMLQIWPIVAMRLGAMPASWDRLESLQKKPEPDAEAPGSSQHPLIAQWSGRAK